MLAMAVVGFLSLENPVVVDRDGVIAGFSSSLFSNPASAPSQLVFSGGYVSGFEYVPFYASGGFSVAGLDAGVFVKGVPTSMRVYLKPEDVNNATYTFVGEFALGGAVSKIFPLGFAELRAGLSVMGLFGRVYEYSSFGGGLSLGAVASFKVPLKVSLVAGPLGYVTSYAGNGGYMTASTVEFGVRYSLGTGFAKISPVAGAGYRLDGLVYIPVGVTFEFSSLPLSLVLSSRLLSSEYAYGVVFYRTPVSILGGNLGVSAGIAYNLFGFSGTVALSVK